MWPWSLRTMCDTTLGMEGGQEECYCHSCSVFLSPPTLFRLPHFAHRRPPGKNEGISMLVEFSVINPVCHATVLACLFLLHSLSIHPSFSPTIHIHLSLHQVGELIALSSRKKAPSGDVNRSGALPGLLF